MIIFYNKENGEIKGLIEGRIHGQSHLKQWVGDRNEIKRIVIQWKPYKWLDRNKNEIPIDCLDACDEDGNLLATNAHFEPDYDQKEIIITIDKNPISIYDYKIDTNSLKLVKK